MDDVQFSKSGTINHNSIKTNQGMETRLTVPINRKGSETTPIKDITIAKDDWQKKHYRVLEQAYLKCPFWKEYGGYFHWLYCENVWTHLSQLNLELLKKIMEWFDLRTRLVIASQEQFAGQRSELILNYCQRFDAGVYIFGKHGIDYADLELFDRHRIALVFQDYHYPVYQQRTETFLPNLSFVDLLFNHGPESKNIFRQGNLTKEEILAKGDSDEVGSLVSAGLELRGAGV